LNLCDDGFLGSTIVVVFNVGNLRVHDSERSLWFQRIDGQLQVWARTPQASKLFALSSYSDGTRETYT
jgi:hypothetical protein